MIIPFLLFLLVFGFVVVALIVAAIRGLSRRSCGSSGYRRSYYSDSPPFISYDSSSYGPGIPPVHIVHHVMDAAGQPIIVDSGGYVAPDNSGPADNGGSCCDSGNSFNSSSFDSGSSGGFDSGSSSGSSDCGGGGGSGDCGGSSCSDSSSAG